MVGKVVDMFGLKGEQGRHIYDVVNELSPERREFYEKQARVVAAFIAGKPKLRKALDERRLRVWSDNDRTKTFFLEIFARK
jgi:hypothetical protein